MNSTLPSKKRRKLFIVDMDELDEFKKTLGPSHTQLQKHILSLAEQHKLDVEKIPDQVWIKADKLLDARTAEEANDLIKTASDYALMTFKSLSLRG